MLNYSGVLTFFIISITIAFIIVGASYLLALRKPDPEKVSVYECGFDPFSDSRQKFEVRFFLVGILFIIFDLEISFLIPWSVLLGNNLVFSPLDITFAYWAMMIFLFILTIGLVYEWMKGGLEWE